MMETMSSTPRTASVGTHAVPRGREFTRAERDALPDDGRRQELIDGCLIVTPAPSARHQVAGFELAVQLRQQIPDHLRILAAPLDVDLDDENVLEPDVLVAPKTAFNERGLPQPPLLAAEVLSPSTRRVDLTLKRARHEAAGCPSFWVVDPADESLTIWELDNDHYAEIAHATGAGTLDVTKPFPATIRLAALCEEA
jgi:Uma2 family endonuclease